MNTFILLTLLTTSPLLSGYSVHAGLSEGGGDLYGYVLGTFGQFGVGFWRKVYGNVTSPNFAFEFTSLNVGDTTDSGRSISYSMGFGAFADFRVPKFTPYIAFYLHFLPWEKTALTLTLHYSWGYMDNRPHGLSFGAGMTFFGQAKEYSLARHKELERKRREKLADTLIAHGITKIDSEQIDSAMAYFQAALEVAPWNQKARALLGEAHFRKGVDYAQRHLPDSALSEFSIAYQLKPELPYLSDWIKYVLHEKAVNHYNLAQKYLSEGDYKSAIDEFKQVFQVDSSFPINRDSLFANLYFKYGLKDMADSNYEDAVKHFEKSMEYDSSVVLAHKDSLVKVYVNTGIDLIASGKLEDGISRLEHAIDLDPSLKDSLKGQLASAYFDYGFSLGQTDDPQAHFMFAMGHFYSGDRKHTLEELRKFYDKLNQTPEIGRPYIRDLFRLAAASDPVVRGAALSSIEIIARTYPHDVAKFTGNLINFIDDPDRTCRYEAALAISWISRADYEKVLPYLDRIAAHLDDESADVRFAVVSTLTSVAKRDPQAVMDYLEKVKNLLTDPDEYVRSAAEEFVSIVKPEN